MPSFGEIAPGVVFGGIALVVLVLFGFETVWSVRRALRQPRATAEALRSHDRAAGSLGRAAAIAGVIASATVLSLTVKSGHVPPVVPLSIGAAAGLLVLIIVERRWPAPCGTVRAADLQPRRLMDVLPRAGSWIAGVSLLLTAGATVISGVQRSARNSPVGSMIAATSWPGWRWSVPQVVALGLVAALAVVLVVQLLHRPALAGFDRRVDLNFRRAGVDRGLRVVAVVGFCEVAILTNAIKNAGLDAGVNAGLTNTFAWLSVLAGIAALLSISAFRTRPPKQTRSTGPAAAVVQ